MRKSDSTAWKVALGVAVVVAVVAIGAMSVMRAPDDPVAQRVQAKQAAQEHDSVPTEHSDLREAMARFDRALQVAQLTEIESCEWAEQQQYAEGHPLKKGQEVELLKGHAKIMFNSGAKVILEGPAKFKLVSTTSGKLTAGKLTADVPDDVQNFTIDTPVARIVDADFVRSDKSEDTPDPAKPVRLGKGQSIRLGAGESIRID